MHCPTCGLPVQPGKPFCGRCGARLIKSNLAPTKTLTGATPSGPLTPSLVVERPGEPDFVVPLGQHDLRVGRADDCDVIVDAPGMSRHHALISQQNGSYMMRDLGSTNGLFEAGQRVEEAVLRPGIRIRVPDPYGNVITFTMRADGQQAAAPLAPLLPGTPSTTIPLDPQRAEIGIGRDPANPVRVDEPLVSRFHAQLERRGADLVLTDLRSTNGTYVNGQRVSGSRALQDGDEIVVGSVRLFFRGAALERPDEHALVRIDARDLVRRIERAGHVILDRVSLSILPMEFVALIGGSGAGKSTLLHALCGARQAQEGAVLFNGHDLYKTPGLYSKTIGYVPQDDILHRDLPVAQALRYAARLRLPPDTSPDEREARINAVLADVQMEAHREKLISRLSGGQRKRVSIALELLANPSVLFLDEPTSGLDPGLDKKVMGLLQLLSDKGHTVVLVTHATENIQQCDLVAIVAHAHLVYYGPPADAPAHFGVSSFPDIYSYCEQVAGQIGQEEQRFQQSSVYQTYVDARRQQAAVTAPITVSATPQSARQARAAAIRQWGILTQRYAELVWRDRVNLVLLLAQAPIVGLLLIFVANSDSFTLGKFVDSQEVLIMLTLAAIWFGTINAAREIVKERPIYLRERMVNLRIWSYVLSKFAVLSVLSVVQSLALVVFVTFKTPHLLDRDLVLPAFLAVLVTLILTSLAGLASGLLISSLVTSSDRAMSIVPVVLLAAVIFCGGIFPSQIISYIFVSFWCLRALGSIVNLDCLGGGPCLTGSAYNMYSNSGAGDLLFYWLLLILWTIFFLALTYSSLRRRDAAIG